jgi:hypothetical protein
MLTTRPPLYMARINLPDVDKNLGNPVFLHYMTSYVMGTNDPAAVRIFVVCGITLLFCFFINLAENEVRYFTA